MIPFARLGVVAGSYEQPATSNITLYPTTLEEGIANQSYLAILSASGGTWGEQSKLTASDAETGDLFGDVVAIYSDTIAVGAYAEDASGFDVGGAVYVYTRSANTWTQQQKLIASDVANVLRFGTAASVYDNTLLVGANPQTGAGKGYIFTRSGNTWTEQQILTISDANNQGLTSCWLDNDTFVLGSPGDDTGGTNRGAVYVFTGSGNNWTQQAKLIASDAVDGDQFGIAVDLYNGTLVVGAYLTDDTASGAGSAYVFTGSGNSWTQQAKLVASDPELGDNFGRAVAIDDDTIVVGAPNEDGTGGTNLGAAYVFTGSGNSWTQQAKLVASDGANSDQFGRSVDIYGNTLIVGALGVDTESAANIGAVYVFTREGNTWTEQQKLISGNISNTGILGIDSAISGSTIIGGASGDDANTGNTVYNSGAAFVFTGYDYSVTTGSLPTGLTLDANGTITGTPTTTGNSTFTITATDTVSATGNQSYSLTIA